METVKFTANEIEILKAIFATGQHEDTQHYMIEDLVSYTGKSVNAIKGILSSLRKKYIIYTYAGEYAFDGEVREDAEELVNQILNNITPENDKPETDMENKSNPMMDERIVRINEILSTKLSSVSKSKREGIKAEKTAAKFILEGWDDVEDINAFVSGNAKETYYELYCIAKSRLDQLKHQAEQDLIEKIEGGEHPILKVNEDSKTVVFSHNDTAKAFILNRMAHWLRQGYKLTIRSWCTGSTRVQMVVGGTITSLKNLMGDEIEITVNGTDRYPDAVVTLKNDETTSETTTAAAEIPKTDKTITVKKTARSKHEVGDLHPNGKWVWTEYAPGKFDWRVNKHDNLEVNRKEQERDLDMDKPKTAKKATKVKKQVEKPVKVRAIEEILATKPQGISEPQERVFKLLRKGYRIDPNADTPQGFYTLIKDGRTIVVIEAVMNALMSRLKLSVEEIAQFKA